MTKSRSRSVVSVLILSVLAGCSGETELPHGQGTPEALMSKFVGGVLNGNKEAFVECFTSRRKGKEFGDALYGGMRKTTELNTALEQKYGEGAWMRFTNFVDEAIRDDPTERKGPTYFYPLYWADAGFLGQLTYVDADALGQRRYETRDGDICARNSQGIIVWMLVERQSVYRIDPSKLLRPEDRQDAIDGGKIAARACEETLRALQQNDTADVRSLAHTYKRSLFGP